ncbi:MAG: NAD-dependent epimerase/dehydratase family protein [Candidatus Hodarchaeota archaeon]
MSKILITGATGFIGSYLVKYFVDKNLHIIAHGSSKESIYNLNKELKYENVNLKLINFWQENFLKNNWSFPDFSDIKNIIHCAAATKVREGTIENYDKFFGLNVLATKKLAKKALDAKINHFIHLSTGQVYGTPPSFPFTENTPKKPINIYGFTKLLAEIVISSFGNLGLKYTIVRPFSVYGKGQHNIISIIKDKIINNEILTIYGDGTQSRAFTHVNDICKAIEIILNNPKCLGEEYNLSGTKEYSINQLFQLISKKLKKKPKIVYKEASIDELKRNFAETKKTQKIGYKQSESLEAFIENELI